MSLVWIVALAVAGDRVEVVGPEVGLDVDGYQSQRFRDKSELYQDWFSIELGASGLDLSNGDLRILPTINQLECMTRAGGELCHTSVTWAVLGEGDLVLYETTLNGEHLRRLREGDGGLLGLISGEYQYSASSNLPARDASLLRTAQEASRQTNFGATLADGTARPAGPRETFVPLQGMPEELLRPVRSRNAGLVLTFVAPILVVTGAQIWVAEVLTDSDTVVGPVLTGGGTVLTLGGTALVLSSQIRIGRYWSGVEGSTPGFAVNP